MNNKAIINKADVTNTYSGAEGCACGCQGTYATSGSAVTRRVNEVNKALANGELVEIYHFAYKDCYEYTKPNGRVIRIYTKKN